MKRLTAILLTLAMVVSLCVVFATAEGSKNLALGCDVTGAEPSSHTANANYGGKLTDGNAADGSAIGTKDEWFCYYQNPDAKPETWNTTDTENRIGVAVIDLKAVCTVENVRVHVFTGNHWGIIAPKSITVSVSENGTDYTKVGAKEYEKIETENMMEEWSEFKLATAAAARYVKVEVALNGNFAFLNEIEVIGVEGAPAAPVAEDIEEEILVSHRNLYNWAPSFEDIIIAKGYFAWSQDKPVNSVADLCTAANVNAAAFDGCLLLAVELKDGKYVVTAQVDSLSGSYDCPEEGFLLVLSPNNSSYPKVAGKDLVGAVVEVPEEAIANNYAIDTKQDGNVPYVLKVTKKASAQGGENVPEKVMETIEIDGDLDDNGWIKGEWISFNQSNSSNQADPVTDGKLGGQAKVRVDDEWMYVAFKYNNPVKRGAGNGKSTNLRTWIHNGDAEATVYTSFYDVYVTDDGSVGTVAKYNTSKTENKAAAIENSSIVAMVNEEKGTFEWKVKLSEIGGDKITIRFNLADTVNSDGTNISILYPAVGENGTTKFPYKTWEAGAYSVDESLALGEVPADADYSALLGIPNADPAFNVELTANAETYKVGDTVKVTLTVKSEKQFSGVSLKLNYDKAKVEALVKNNEEDGNADMAAFVSAEGWEAVCSLDEENGCYNLSFVNEESAADELVINVEFKVVAAEGDVVFYVAHSDATVDVYAEGALFPETLAGNGSYAVVKEAAPAPGDAGVIMLVVLSVVAALGCAVVVKATR